MKTLSVAVFWPAWEWIENPETKFIFASYSQGLSDKSARQHRHLVQSPWYQERWGAEGAQIEKDSVKQVRFFENSKQGFRFSTSVSGEVTGRHADILVFDDLIKTIDADMRIAEPHAIQRANEFWFRVMPSPCSRPQHGEARRDYARLHYGDVAAHCIDTGDYEVLSLPMEYEKSTRCTTSIGFKDPRKKEGELLFKERFPIEWVGDQKTQLGSQAYAAQYQQRPAPSEGLLFKRDWFKHWKEGQFFRPHMRIVHSWDCAFKSTDSSDFVAGQVWGQVHSDFPLLDQTHARMSFLETVKAICELAEKWPADCIFIEEAANGAAVIDTLKDTIPAIVGVKPLAGSRVRAQAVTPLWEAGNVWLPPAETHPWVESFKEELATFPFAPHDDRVDAMTQALIQLRQDTSVDYYKAVSELRGLP